jgi:Inorganic Pyrophosphatase
MPLAKKSWGPLSFRIDRPKGTVKKWDQPDGSVKTFVYPCDYGYFPRLKGEDGEGLDAFVGDQPEGHLESFLKLKKDDKGRMVPDETKFVVGLTDQEREKVYRLYGTEIVNRKVYGSVEELQRDLDQFRPARKGRYAEEKTAGLNAHPSVEPGSLASPPLWKVREDEAKHHVHDAEARRAALVKTKSGKNIPPWSDVQEHAVKKAMAFYGVKNADIDKILNGVTLFSDHGDSASPSHAHAAEAADKAGKLDRAFKGFDDRQGAAPGQGTESSVGSLFQGDVVG